MSLWLALESQAKSFLEVFSSKEVIAALLGALVGGVMTYLATSALEKRKQRNLELSLSSLALTEVLGHLAALERSLDKVLPHWLKRNRSTYQIDYDLDNTSILASKIYDQFFGVLAGSALGPFLVLHYNRLPEYNRYAMKQPVTVPYDQLSFYVQNLALLIEGGVDLADRLRRLRGMRHRIPREFRAALQFADEHRPRVMLMAALSRTDESSIRDLLANKPVRLPDLILSADRDQLRNLIS